MGGLFCGKKVNGLGLRTMQYRASAERRNPASLLNQVERMIRTRKEFPEFEFPEFAQGKYRLLESDRPDAIFAHACEDREGNAVVAAHNLSRSSVAANVRLWTDQLSRAVFYSEKTMKRLSRIRICQSHWKVTATTGSA